VADQLHDGTRFRALTILDVYTREAVAIEAGQSLKGEDVVRVLNRVKQQRGVPKFLFCDNGSELAHSDGFSEHGVPLEQVKYKVDPRSIVVLARPRRNSGT
jgi:transposase InsO family protein